MREYSYKFSPSLLDKFSNYLDSEALYEKFYGSSEEPALTYQEYEAKQFKELIDAINRVPFESEAASKGSCLNEIVDCIVMKKKSTRDDITLLSLNAQKFREYNEEHEGAWSQEWLEMYRVFSLGGGVPCIYAKNGNYFFYFEKEFCMKLADYFKDSLCQVYVEAPIDTRYGKVLLYGFPDYIRGDMVYDLKTTSKYDFGKYAKYWQQHVYPYVLTESGKCTDIRAFEFTAFAMKGGTSKTPLIYGDMYPELYVYEHERSKELLRGICEKFAEFLNANRNLITDEKIFGGERKASVPSDEEVDLLFKREMERAKHKARMLVN